MSQIAAVPNLADPYGTDGLLLLDPFLRISKSNLQAERILRASPHALIGKHVIEVLPTEFTAGLNPSAHQVSRIKTDDNLLLIRYEPMEMDGVAGIVLLRYVSWQAQLASGVEALREAAQSLGVAVDSPPVEIYVTDGLGNTLSVSGAEDLYGVPASSLVGRNVYNLEKEGFFSPCITPIVVNSKKPATIVQETKAGRMVMASANPVFDRNGEISLIVTTSSDISDLFNLKRQLADLEELVQQNLTTMVRESPHPEGMIIESPSMLKVVSTLQRVANFESTVLLLGESGTGKDTLARLLHRSSPRSAGTFINVNCGAIPETLMESEFFGYAGGAFTGANKTGKKGLIELADHGTLFLDEVDSLSLHMQAKLLHVIQLREFMPVGGTRSVSVDVRFVAATNKNLENLVKEGGFREDLYYRLNVIPIHIPPLRERREEVIPLAEFFLKGLSRRYGVARKLYAGAMEVLTRYDWPGNVRELENVIERAVVTSTTDIITGRCLVDCLQIGPDERCSTAVAEPTHGEESLCEVTADAEKAELEEALRKYGSTRKVAAHLGVNQSTVVRRMRKFGISVHEYTHSSA